MEKLLSKSFPPVFLLFKYEDSGLKINLMNLKIFTYMLALWKAVIRAKENQSVKLLGVLDRKLLMRRQENMYADIHENFTHV